MNVIINERCTGAENVQKKNRYNLLLKHFQKTSAPVPADIPSTHQSGIDSVTVTTFGTKTPSSSKTSATFPRRSTSLAGINLSLMLE